MSKRLCGLTVVTERGGELLPRLVAREDRLAALQKALPAGGRPALFVEIEEQHLGAAAVPAAATGAAVIDPAAETEVTVFAKQTGFEVIDAKQGKRSDAAVILQGEAISEPAVRHGNLVSAKARVEVKAIEVLLPLHIAQVVTYLRMSNCNVGLLINFNAKTIKDGLKRIVV
jgi:GxxExxY protein